ncbi:MAG TPA: site-specific integrase [Chloroflexota bacterium]|nr:site-specific integrase [Chloroflexota bacterium]
MGGRGDPGRPSTRKRRRFGYVRRMASGRWQASYLAADGTRHLAADTFPSKGAADRWLRSVEEELERGEWSDPRLRRLSFGDWAEEWLETTIHLRGKTRENYESILRNHLLPAFGDVEIGRLDQLTVRRWLAEVADSGRSPKTVANIRQVFSLVMDCAVGSGALRVNPCLGLKVARGARQEMHFLTPEQVSELADEVENPPVRSGGGEHRRETYPEYGLLVRLAAWTGLRAGELAALRCSRIDLLHGHLEVAESASEVHGKLEYGPTKTYERRTVPLTATIRDALDKHLQTLPGGDAFVFPGPDGGALRHKNWYSRHFKPAVKRAGLDGVRFHDLRHTYAGFLIAQGAHPRAIMERMGHSSITVTLNTYGHLLPKIDEALTDGLEEMYQSAEAQRPARQRAPVVPLPERR